MIHDMDVFMKRIPLLTLFVTIERPLLWLEGIEARKEMNSLTSNAVCIKQEN